MPKNKSLKIIGVIPARYASSRFPGKPLADIRGKPMIWWVYKNAKQAVLLSEVFVATDDKRIANTCKKLGMPFIMTSSAHQTGTDRVWEAAKKARGDLYVNIQGDEPLIKATVIDSVIKPLISDSSIRVSNTMTEIIKMPDLINNMVVKVVVNSKNEAIFFSRLPIPSPKSAENIRYFKQMGLYCFTPEALKIFHDLPQGKIEKSECIEMLRFIENRVPIKMVEIKSDTMSVDTPADLEIVRKIMTKMSK